MSLAEAASAAAAVIEAALAEQGAVWERSGARSYVVTLAGSHKLKTVCNLIVGDHTVRVEAFVMRHPDENRERLWELLLRHNARMHTVAFAIDAVGDVYLIGRLSLAAVTAAEVDRVLGCVLEYADSTFNQMLEVGFGSAIRREWAWRVARGESLENLKAFAYFVQGPQKVEPPGLVTGE